MHVNSKMPLKVAAFLAGLFIVVLFHVMDRSVSRHPALIIFYVIPVSLVTWFSGTIAGVFIALCSIMAWISHGTLEVRNLYSNSFLFGINMTARGSFLFVVIYVLRKLKIALAHEKELNQRKSDFVANVSHELNNPLAVIRESMNLVIDGSVGEVNKQQKEVLEAGVRGAERLIRLVKDLLDISKIEAGKLELKIDEVDIALLVESVLKDNESEIFNKGLGLKKDILQDAGLILADRDKIIEVITNLLHNAVKYTSSGIITVRLSGDKESIHFEIADTGPGIPREYQQKIFDKFERVTAEKTEGTGLGLPITKDIIELHKGKIRVDSAAGNGSKFIITLPRDFKKAK